MSKQSADPTFSPLLLLVPLPFVLATCLPLEIDHPAAPIVRRFGLTDHPAAPKVQQVAGAQAEPSDRTARESASSASQPAPQTHRPRHPR